MDARVEVRDVNPPTKKAQPVAALNMDAHIQVRHLNAFYGKVQFSNE